MKIYMSDGNTFIWQWQPKEHIVLEGYPDGVFVHYANCNTAEAPVVQSRRVGDKLIADIPPELMQEPHDITVYVCDADGTLHSYFIPVVERPKPESYIYEPVEILRYESLAKRIAALEEGGVGGVALDTTLTQSGKAADAKATGDEIKRVEGLIPSVEGLAKTDEIPTKPEDIGAQPKGDYLTEAPVTAVNGKTGAVVLGAPDVGAEPVGAAAGAVSAHNGSNAAHSDIRLLIEGLANRLNALANSTDTDLDQLAEIVAYIKSNKSLIDAITTSKVSVTDIVDNLTTNVSNKPLSAAMGVALASDIDSVRSSLVNYQPKGNYLTSAPVTSVNGKTGAVVLGAGDVGARPDTWVPTAQEVGALPNTYVPPTQTAEQVGADPKGTAASVVSQHNASADSHGDIRLELKAINDKMTAFFDSDNQTLDELSEIVAYITSNKSLIDSITTSKVSVADIINNLTSNVSNKPLSAAQGVAIKALIDRLASGKLDASKLTEAINTALAQAKASGEFDGPQGQQGDTGEDGVSPTVEVSTITGGHRITITDATGTKNVDVMDGEDGDPGTDGRGIKSIARTSGNGAAGSTDTYTITYTDGSANTFTVRNGSNGATGQAATLEITGVTALEYGAAPTVTEQSGSTAQARKYVVGIPAGSPGADYVLTDEDREQIAKMVIDDLGGRPVYGYVDESTKAVVLINAPGGEYTYYYELEDGTLVEIGKAEEDNNVYYSVTNTLTNCTSSNAETQVVEGGSYEATITANSGYELESVTVTMGGVDITATAVSGGKITIAAVSGDIVVTAVAEEIVANYTNLFAPVSTQINKRLNSSNAVVSADGYIVTNFIDVSDKVPFTANTKIYIKGAGFTNGGDTSIRTFTTSGTLYTDSYSVVNGSSASITDEGNGVISVTNLSASFTANVVRLCLSLKVEDTAITTADIANIVITIDEPITDGAVAPAYTNLLPLATDTDGSLFVGPNGEAGYKPNTRVRMSNGEEQTATGIEATGFIPVKYKQTLYIKGITIARPTSETTEGLCFYNSSRGFICGSTMAYAFGNTSGEVASCKVYDTLVNGITADADIAYARISATVIGPDSVVTVDEPLE